jgi:hypothetical protein
MDKPDSLYSAAKKMAELAQIPWSKFSKIYKALQEGEEAKLLPISSGRAICYAHPSYVSRMILALAGCDFENGPRQAVLRFSTALSQHDGTRLEERLSGLLMGPETEELENIEFLPDQDLAIISMMTCAEEFYVDDAIKIGDTFEFDSTRWKPGPIRTRTIVDGDLLRQLKKQICWDTALEPPSINAL